MAQHLTRVTLKHEEYRHRHELVFGEPVSYQDVCGDMERYAFFAPDQLFGLEVWEANDYGTVLWILYIMRAVHPGENGTPTPQVSPGAEILLAVRGQKKIRRAHSWLRSLTVANRPLASIDPDYYRASHYRFKLGIEPRDLCKPNGRILQYLKEHRRV